MANISYIDGIYCNIKDAKIYIDWLISDEAKELINNFKKNGKQLFFFNHH